MDVKKLEPNLKLHLKIIYTFLVLNVTLCTFCLYLLLYKQTADGQKDSFGQILTEKLNITAVQIKDRQKRDIYSAYYRTTSGFIQQCAALSNACKKQTNPDKNSLYHRTRRVVEARGPPGPPGPPGEPGRPGYNGTKGEKGDKGHQGLLGFPGFKGEKGLKGNPGEKGERGPVGPSGLRGTRGPPGDRGPSGSAGPPGKRGRRGNDGPMGQQGPQGLMGPQGPPGLKGEKGDSGDNGLNRGKCTCSKGEKGEKGTRGQLGYTGFKGDKGDPGPKGDPGFGYQGFKGTNGYIGLKGVKGDKGAKGDTVVIESGDNASLVRNRKFLPEENSQDRKVSLSQYKEISKAKNGKSNSSNMTGNVALIIFSSFLVFQVFLRYR